jgi:hypothetical protein
MKKLFNYSLCFFLLFLVAGCYKDKGNYEFTDINKITITSTASSYSVLVPDSLKIDVDISQTIPSADGLTFQWVLYPNTAAPLTRRTVGTSQNLRAAITEDPGSYLLDLYVKDNHTNVEFQKHFTINVVTALSEGWVVVEEVAGGSDLSVITPLDVVFRNVYSKANAGRLLPAGTFRIPDIKTNRNIQSFYVISPENMELLNTSNFLKISGFEDLFFQAPSPVRPKEYFMNGDQEALVNDGKPYGRNLINVGNNKLNLPPVGTYYMAPFELYSSSLGYMWYDTIGQKFYRQDPNNFSLLTFATAAGDPFNMNAIGKRIIYAETNTAGNYYAFFKNNNNDSLFAYQFSNTARVAVYAGLTAPTMLNAKYFVMSRTLPYLYYVNGNSIYKLDILAKTAAAIYTFPAGTEIRAMKMYRNLKNSADVNQNKLIAVATYEAGNQGKVYYFPITATGNFTGNTFSKVIGGFGKINEITFKSLK